MKKCNTCETEKDYSEFYKDKKNIGGLSSQCKKCAIKRAKEWKAKNPDRVKKSIKKKRIERGDELLKIESEYREKNRIKINESATKYREANRDKCRERCLNHYHKNPEKHREYRESHAEEFREYSKTYREKNVEKIRERKRELEKKYRDLKKPEHAARKAVCMALKRGKLVKSKNCQWCNSEENIEAHHADYSKQLDVIWVCRKCHREMHVTLNRKNRVKL